MNAVQVMVRGTLKPDGSLELLETPSLPPGPVEVLIRVVPTLKEGEESWFEWLVRARAEMVAKGFQPRSKEEIDADFAREREMDRERDAELERLQSPRE